MAHPHGPVWPTWRRGPSSRPRMVAVGAWPVPGPCVAAVVAWPGSYAPYGRRRGVARPLGPVRPPWGCGPSSGPRMPAVGRDLSAKHRMAAVEAWPVPWAPYVRRGGVALPLAPCGRRGGLALHLGPVWPPWGRGLFFRLCVAAVGAWLVPRATCCPRGSRPVPWAPCGCRAGVVGPLGLVWTPWVRGRSAVPVMLPLGVACPLGPVTAVGSWLVPWAPSGRCGVVAGPLGPVWPPWGRGCSPGPRLTAVESWPVPWAPSGCRGVVAGPLGLVWPPWGSGLPLGPVWPPCGRGPSRGSCIAVVGA